jgi:predicted nucleotidyltransferase
LVEFFRKPGTTAHVREMARRVRASPAAVGTELAGLARLGILRAETVGRSLVYAVNEKSPLVPEMRSLVQKTLGVEAEIAEAVNGLPGLESAYLFGSYASGLERAGSDIDLLVIGKPDPVALSERLAPVERTLGRDVNVVSRTMVQLRSRRKEPFWERVLGGPLVHLAGREIAF